MTILEFVTIVSGGASIVGGVDVVQKHFTNSTPEDLFKKSFIDAVKQIAPSLDDVADPKTIEVNHDTLNKVIASLEDIDINELAAQEGDEKLAQATALFRDCITLPGCQLRNKDLLQRLQPVIERTFTNFYDRLPRNQQAANQLMLKYDSRHLEGQKHLSDQNQAILDGIQKLDSKLPNLSSKHIDLIVSDAVDTALAKEHQLIINNAKDLLKNNQPKTAFKQLDDLWQRIGNETSTPEISKFNILTNMAAAQFALNNEQEAAKLFIEAFQYNSEDEKALSNRALAYHLLGETENAANYAEQTLEKNPANVNAHVVLILISSKKEPLEKVIAQVPDYLHKTPEIAHAFSDIAKEQGDLKVARKWREIMVEQEQDDDPGFKASLATILIEQVLDDGYVRYTKQLDDSQRKQLHQAVDLLSEAWNCVAETELRSVRTDWIINRSMALRLLDESEAAIKDLDLAIENEPSDSTLLPTLLRNRGILAFEQGNRDSAIDFFERIQSEPENIEAQLTIANILFASKRYDEAITKLNNLLKTNLSFELQDEVNRRLVRAYIADERIKEAQSILKPMQESSPTNIFNLINAALISSKMGNNDKANSILKEAYKYALDSTDFLEIVELAAELFIHEQFKEAAILYEKLADTSQNSQLTQWLIQSYYNAGEIGKALEICKGLREKYGPLENVTEIEVMIYEQIGDLNQAEVVCKEYLNEFPDDIDMRIRLGMICYRLDKVNEVDRILDSLWDFKNLSLEACVQLSFLHQVRSQPERALHVMYETRRTHYKNPDAHLKYIGLFYQVEKRIQDVLSPDQVQIDTVVQIDSSDQPVWYIIVDRDDVDITRGERDINDTFTKQLLGKRVGDEVNYGKTVFGTTKIGEIADIKSKYVYACQESFEKYPELFPGDQGVGSITLDDSKETDDPAYFQPLFDVVNQQHEDLLRIEQAYKENPLPIGTLANLYDGNVLNAWSHLITKPDLGILCCVGNIEEKRNALTLLENSQPKLVVDLISLITLHCLEAADTVVKVFGKLCIAQSTIDVLLQIIHEREGMWSQRESMRIEKQGSKYVRHMSNPEDKRRNVEYLKNLIKWITENCAVLPCTAMLDMNLFQKQKLDDMLQPLFTDTLLIAGQPGSLLLSDDGRLRTYAETNFNSDAGTNFQIDGVWTQVVLEHCLNQNALDKVMYNRMVIQLVCFNYYHTEFGTDVLMEALKQANWNLAEPYNSLVQALGGQKTSLQKALNVAVDFLFKIWEEQIPYNQLKFVTLGLLAGLTSGRNTLKVLDQLEYLIENKHTLFLPVENRILRQIQEYEQLNPFERNFEFLSEDDIRIKGTRIGIESVLYESLHLSQTPEEIVERFHTLTLEDVYATILYYLQNPIKIGGYLADNLQYSEILREEYEKNPPPGVVRLRQLKAEKQAASDGSHTNIPENNSTTPSSPKKEQE